MKPKIDIGGGMCRLNTMPKTFLYHIVGVEGEDLVMVKDYPADPFRAAAKDCVILNENEVNVAKAIKLLNESFYQIVRLGNALKDLGVNPPSFAEACGYHKAGMELLEATRP